MSPDDRQYSNEHEWVRIEAGEATIGISDHAQDALGDIVFLQLPEVGQKVSAGESCGEIESVKSVSPMHSPISGTVTAVNQVAVDTPEIVNRDAYGEGWLFKLEAANASEVDGLMTGSEYEAFIEEQA